MLKPKVYLDTSVISALFDERTPERQSLTKSAWQNLKSYDIYISELVIDELTAASETLKKSFQEIKSELLILSVTKEAENLAEHYISKGIFPEKYRDDALHVAIASVNSIAFLLSWNFKHLVKVKTRRLVTLVNSLENYSAVEIIAPPEL